jgi:CHASE3 domain sensor protein
MIASLLAWVAASLWARAALRYGVLALAVLLFLLSIRRAGERAGRLAERLETMENANDVQRQMLDAAARRPRDRGELADRLRDGRF